jgi:hypothetical protein
VNRPGFNGRPVPRQRLLGGVLTVVRLLELDRRDVAQRAVQPGPQRHLPGDQGQLGRHPRGGAPPTIRRLNTSETNAMNAIPDQVAKYAKSTSHS